MKHNSHHAKGRKLGQIERWKGHRFYRERKEEESSRQGFAFLRHCIDRCGLKTGTNQHTNNTPATGESSKRRIFVFFDSPLLHLILLLLPTPVSESVWGPFCLSMMSYLVRVVSICQDTRTHTHAHTHTATACSTSVLRAALFSGVRSPSRVLFCNGHRFTHLLKPMFPAAMLHLSVLFLNKC